MSKSLFLAESGDYIWNEPGIWGVLGEWTTRKFHLVYVHWLVAVVFWVALILAIFLHARRAKPDFGQVPRWLKACWYAYVVVIGMTVYNRVFLTHEMIGWGYPEHLRSMLRSLVLAAVPVAAFLLWARRRHVPPRRLAAYSLVLFLSTHTTMAFFYVYSILLVVE